MKAWNPSKQQYDVVPPLPEFVGSWQVGEPARPASVLRRIAHTTARRARAALRVLLDGEAAAPGIAQGTQGIEVTPIPAPLLSRPEQVALPMSSVVAVRPGQTITITSRPQAVGFRAERIVIGGDPSRWVVEDIKIGRRSQLADDGSLPGAAFSADAENAEIRLDAAALAVKFAITATYVGPEAAGEVFSCVALGASTLGPDEGGEVSRIYLPLSSGTALLPGTSAQITARPQDLAFRPERIIIGGDPSAWVVDDIKIGNRSQFSQSGSVPGRVFAATFRGSPAIFETAQTAMDVSIYVTYIGSKEEGEPLLACAIGRVAS